MKKTYNLWATLRSATRAVWMYSPHHREALAKADSKDGTDSPYTCLICKKAWPKPMMTLDHFPPVGSFDSWETYADWCRRLFEGNVRVIDKLCHKKVTAAQRKKQ